VDSAALGIVDVFPFDVFMLRGSAFGCKM